MVIIEVQESSLLPSELRHIGVMLWNRMQAWILAIRVLVRCAVAESRLAAGVFQGDYAEAAFGEVVAKSLQNVAMFGEAIVHGRRCHCPPPPSDTSLTHTIYTHTLHSTLIHGC